MSIHDNECYLCAYPLYDAVACQRCEAMFGKYPDLFQFIRAVAHETRVLALQHDLERMGIYDE